MFLKNVSKKMNVQNQRTRWISISISVSVKRLDSGAAAPDKAFIQIPGTSESVGSGN